MYQNSFLPLSFLGLLAIVLSCGRLQAQSTDDALRYAQTGAGGTARSMGMAGAFSSIGADFSCAATNPAGLALYRRAELSISPALQFSSTETTYLDSTLNDSRNNFNLNHFSYVSARTVSDEQKATRNWYSSSFAIGYNRLANYNRQQSFAGFNTENSITAYYADIAAGIPEDQIRETLPFDAGLAYWVYLINPDATGNNYTPVVANGNVLQSQFQFEKGGLDEAALSFAGNYRDKLYLGATLGVPVMNYTREKTYRETDASDIIDNFDNLEQIDVLKAKGTGINGKLGLIYRPLEALRLGFAVHTPTLLRIEEEYSTIMSSFTTQALDDSSEGSFDYRITTPWHINAGTSFLFGKSGLISLDYAWTDFSQTEFNTDGNDVFRIQMNTAIRQKFKAVSTLRLGGEYAYKIFRFRAGYSLSSSPYKEEALSDLTRQSITGGIGIRDENIFADIAFVHSSDQNRYTPYGGASDVALATNANNVVFTLGFRF